MGLFGGSKSSKPIILEAFTGAREMLKEIAEAAKPKGLAAIGMAGEGITDTYVPPSSFQQAALGDIGSILNRPFTTDQPLFQKGVGIMEKAAEGFDPFSDLRYKALQTNLERELRRAKDRIASRSSARDKFFGGGRMDQEREIEEYGIGRMANLAGQLEQQSRAQQLAVAPELMRIANMQTEEPLTRLNEALYGIGAAPRTFEQEKLASQEAARQQRLNELATIGLNTAIGATSFRPDFYTPSYGPSTFSQLMPLLGMLGNENFMGGLGQLGSSMGGLFGGFGGLFGGGGGNSPVGIEGMAELAQGWLGGGGLLG